MTLIQTHTSCWLNYGVCLSGNPLISSSYCPLLNNIKFNDDFNEQQEQEDVMTNQCWFVWSYCWEIRLTERLSCGSYCHMGMDNRWVSPVLGQRTSHLPLLPPAANNKHSTLITKTIIPNTTPSPNMNSGVLRRSTCIGLTPDKSCHKTSTVKPAIMIYARWIDCISLMFFCKCWFKLEHQGLMNLIFRQV